MEIGVAYVGLLGGTFDPVHIGHLILAETTRDALSLDHVEFVPAHIPPHKSELDITAQADRLAMLEAAIAGIPHFQINPLELSRPGRSFTVDTLSELNQTRPEDRFVFIVGSDSLRDLPTWHEPNRIVELGEIAVIARPGVEVDLDALGKVLPGLRARCHAIDAPLIDISSSRLRASVREGRSIRFQSPDAVIEYMARHGLYRDQGGTEVPNGSS
jgi:nicotinate-nucleotide adenylyltransferase